MAKVKRFGQGGSSSDPKRYIKRGPNGAQPASKPPVYQKEVAVRKTSEVSSPNSKGVASKAKSTGIRPKVYEGELNGGEVANRSKSAGNIGRDAIEGERVSKPVSKTSTISEGSYRELPKGTSSVSSAKDKIVSGLEKSAKKVPAYEAIKGIPTSKVVTGLGRAAMLEAGPAIAATVLAESADKYGRERGFGHQTRDVPKSSMSKKSDPIVDAINAEPKSKAVTPDVTSKLGGTSPRTDYKPLKDMVSVKEAPAVSKPALKSGTSKPKGPTEGDRARAALKEFKAWNDSRAPLDSDSTKAEDMNTQGKIEAVEGMKKGGMTKRPPKPAKKVPARKFALGGSVSRTSASKRGDGCATKGHTKGKYC
jgi:hypothetical protein